MNPLGEKLVDDIKLDGFLRGIVIEDVDPEKKGKLGVKLTRLMDEYNKKASGVGSTYRSYYAMDQNVSSNPEIFDKLSDIKTPVAAEVADYIWAMPSFIIGSSQDAISQFYLPKKNQVVYCIAEDNDPQKLYWLPFSPTLEDEEILFKNMRITQNKKNLEDPEKFRNVVKLFETPNGNIIGFDYNEDTNSFEITFDSGSTISIEDNKETQQIRISNETNKIVLDKLSKTLSIETEGTLKAYAKKGIEAKTDGNFSIKAKKIYMN
jgi:hypothetical protein